MYPSDMDVHDEYPQLLSIFQKIAGHEWLEEEELLTLVGVVIDQHERLVEVRRIAAEIETLLQETPS